MKRKTVFFVSLAVMLVLFSALAGCSGRTNMLMGRWQLATYGDENGQNQNEYPLPVAIDIYPDGHIDLLESPLGTYTMNRDTFTFKSDDGTMDYSGSYLLDYSSQTPTLTIFMDTEPTSYVLEKKMDLSDLESAKASAAAATPSPAAAAATASAEATATSK